MPDAAEIYEACASSNSGSAEGLLLCLTQSLLQESTADREYIQRNHEYSRNMNVVVCAALAFFMQAGFAMVCAGAVRKKNLQNTMLKNLLDACGAAMAFYSVGYAFAFGDGSDPNGFIGTTNFFLQGVDDVAFWLYQFAFSAASATIVAGTLAERCQMSAYFYYSIMLSGLVYPITVHAIWGRYGFLSGAIEKPLFGVGVLDIAGGCVVHITGGSTALIATWVLGPRRGRFHDEQTGEILETPKDIKGHNIGLQLLGTLILWFGWYGFNSGSALIQGGNTHGDTLAMHAACNTTLAAGAAGVSTLFVNYLYMLRTKGVTKYDLVLTMNGVLSGLVAVTAGCALVEPWAAVLIGASAGVVYLVASYGLISCRFDDAVDAIPVHMASGIWGMLCTGMFAAPRYLEMAYGRSDHPGFFYSGNDGGGPDFNLFGAQIVGCLFVIVWTAGMMLPFFLFLERLGNFRAGAVEEVMGLDKAYFGGLQHGGEDSDPVNEEQIAKIAKQLEQEFGHHRPNKGHHRNHRSNSSDVGKETVATSTPEDPGDDDRLIAKNV